MKRALLINLCDRVGLSIRKALILDFGGVLTNDFWEVLRGFARREGLDEGTFAGLFTRDPDGIELLRGLERGTIGQGRFETELAARLGLEPDGLLQRMGADLRRVFAAKQRTSKPSQAHRRR